MNLSIKHFTVRGRPVAYQTKAGPALDCRAPTRPVSQDEIVQVVRKGSITGRVCCATADGFVFWTDTDCLSVARTD